MSPLDTGFPRDPGPRKRTLPLVTDVVRELARTVSADPAVLFKAARSAVAEELAKVKQGFEAAPLGVLVKRARLQLEREGSGVPVSGPAAPFTPVFPARRLAAREAWKAAPPAMPPAPDEPFENAPSRVELGWEKEIPIQPEDAPFRSAILPIPHRARGPLEISPPVELVPAPGPPAPLTSVPESTAPERKSPEEGEPPPSRETLLGRAGDLIEEPPPEAPKPPAPPIVALARPILLAPPLVAPLEPAAQPASEIAPLPERLEESPRPAMEEFHFKAADSLPPPPPRSGGRGWPLAVALVLAVGVALAWAVREYVFKNETVKSVAPVARKKAEETPVAPAVAAAPLPVPTSAPAAAAKTAAPAAKAPASVPVPKGKAALLMTPDWAGKPAVYVIHFSSTKDRASAAKEAQKLGAALGAPARAVEVDLGEKGVWYRVVVGEFPDVDTARAFRAELEAKKTPGMGFVYEMRGR